MGAPLLVSITLAEGATCLYGAARQTRRAFLAAFRAEEYFGGWRSLRSVCAMASTSRVEAAGAPSGVSSVSGWGGGGSHRSSSVERVDGAAGVASFGVQGGWRPTYDDRHGQGYFFFGQYPEREKPEQQLFTPLVARFASAFAAMQPLSDIRAAAPVLIADLMRGVGIYEFNLKAIAGTLTPQGAVLNRYG
jgi:hypothetical protein